MAAPVPALGPRLGLVLTGWVLMGGVLIGLLMRGGPAQGQPADGPTQAQALYSGGLAAAAQLRGDATPLPAHAAACANCHEPARQPGSNTSAALAPRLDAGLLQAVPRRGGPPVAFDEAAFCRLLRTGLDPAQVLVRRAMPVYVMDDAGCAALWQWLSARAPVQQAVP